MRWNNDNDNDSLKKSCRSHLKPGYGCECDGRRGGKWEEGVGAHTLENTGKLESAAVTHGREDGEGGRASALVAGMGKREVADSVCEWEEKGRWKWSLRFWAYVTLAWFWQKCDAMNWEAVAGSSESWWTGEKYPLGCWRLRASLPKDRLENGFCSQFFFLDKIVKMIPKEDSLKERVRTSRDWKLWGIKGPGVRRHD